MMSWGSVREVTDGLVRVLSKILGARLCAESFAGTDGENMSRRALEDAAPVERLRREGPGALPSTPSRRYRDTLREALADGELDEGDVQRFTALAGELGLGDDRILAIERGVLGGSMRAFLADQNQMDGPENPGPDVRLEGHTGAVKSLAFSPDGVLLASGSSDGMTKLWRPPTGQPIRSLPGQPLRTFPGDMDRVTSVAFSPDGRILASAGENGEVTLYDAHSGTLLRRLVEQRTRYCSVAFSPDGQLLAGVGREWSPVRVRIDMWEPHTGKHLRTLRSDSPEDKSSIAISHDGRRLDRGCSLYVSSSAEAEQGGAGTAELFEHITGQLLATLALTNPFPRIHCVAFSRDGDALATGGSDGLHLWDRGTGEALASLSATEVTSLAFSADGRTLASGRWHNGRDGTIEIWGQGALATRGVWLTGTIIDALTALPVPGARVVIHTGQRSNLYDGEAWKYGSHSAAFLTGARGAFATSLPMARGQSYAYEVEAEGYSRVIREVNRVPLDAEDTVSLARVELRRVPMGHSGDQLDPMEKTIPCSRCGRPAATVSVIPAGTAVSVDGAQTAAATRGRRTSVAIAVVSHFLGVSNVDIRTRERLAVIRAALEDGDVKVLYSSYPTDSRVPAYCPSCDLVYCRDHWILTEHVEEGDGYWNEADTAVTSGRCPAGHNVSMWVHDKC